MAAPAVPVAGPAIAASAEPASVWRDALVAGGVTFLLTVVIVGFETVSGTGELRLQPHPGAVAFAVGAAFLGSAAMGYLRLGNAVMPLVLAAVAAALILLPLLTGDTDSPFAMLLPFEATALNWAALAGPAIVALRAITTMARPRTQAHAKSAARSFATHRGVFVRAMPWIMALLGILAVALPFLPGVDRRLVENCGDYRMGIEGHQPRRSVRRRLGDLRCAERAGGPRLVLDDDHAAVSCLQRRLQHPRQRVGRTARRERHHQRDGIGLRPSR